jgi:hypothetical protein
MADVDVLATVPRARREVVDGDLDVVAGVEAVQVHRLGDVHAVGFRRTGEYGLVMFR